MNQYEKGDLVRCTGAFANSAGTAVDPTAVRFQVRTPTGTTTEYVYGTDAELVRSAAGSYYVDVNANATGTWRYRFYATGTGQSANEKAFRVKDSWF